MEKNSISLDSDAEKLFREIEGIESARQLESFSEVADLLAACLTDEEKRLDKWRIHLVEATYLISSFFMDARFLEGVKNKKDRFAELLGVFGNLSRASNRGDSILIRFRGQPRGCRIPSKFDYVVTCGNLVVDSAIVQAMFNRMGLRMSHLTGRIGRAFEVFSAQGISTLFLKMPKNTPAELALLENSLEIVSRFNDAVSAGRPVLLTKKDKRRLVLPIADETGVPDPNLTLTAALNRLSTEFMKKLVLKIHAWMNASKSELDDRHSGIYEAVFAVPALRKKLIRPPIELNNLKWLLKEKEFYRISREKAIVARHVMDNVKGDAEKKNKVLRSVYGNDYPKIDAGVLGERIEHVSELLDSIEKNAPDPRVQKEIVDNVKSRFEEVREEVFDDLFISERSIVIRSRGRETIIDKVNEKVRELASFFKARARARKKIKSMMRETLDLTEEDYENIAMDFDVPVEDARKIITLLRSCFGEDGGFKRAVFEKHIPEFAVFESKVFDILWHFLKETQTRNDRVAFLNSLQLLISGMNQPEKALKMLIGDICARTDDIFYSDRNSFMLAILLLREYNQELRMDIEITPEEVLEVRKGLNRRAAESARNIIDSDQESFFAKIKTIHGKLLEAVASNGENTDSMPLRYLMSLEREACIFLSLIEGNAARSVLRSAVKEYGNPESEVYCLRKDPAHLRAMLQHLKVAVRALGRLEDEEAMPLLNEIRLNEERFRALGGGPQHENLVRGIAERVQDARRRIYRKNRGTRESS